MTHFLEISLRKTKTPKCESCSNKLYTVNIRREKIGFICPQCDYHFIKNHTQKFKEIVKKIKDDKKPVFKQRIHTICSKCRKSEFVLCRKNTKKPFKNCGFGENTYVCWCENPIHKKEPAWSQNVPKIWITNYN